MSENVDEIKYVRARLKEWAAYMDAELLPRLKEPTKSPFIDGYMGENKTIVNPVNERAQEVEGAMLLLQETMPEEYKVVNATYSHKYKNRSPLEVAGLKETAYKRKRHGGECFVLAQLKQINLKKVLDLGALDRL